MSDEFTEITDYRPCLVERMYQVQFKCPGCNAWIMTENLEVWRDEDFKMVAEAKYMICKSQAVPLCGREIGTVRFPGWRHSAPVKWRDESKAEESAG